MTLTRKNTSRNLKDLKKGDSESDSNMNILFALPSGTKKVLTLCLLIIYWKDVQNETTTTNVLSLPGYAGLLSTSLIMIAAIGLLVDSSIVMYKSMKTKDISRFIPGFLFEIFALFDVGIECPRSLIYIKPLFKNFLDRKLVIQFADNS